MAIANTTSISAVASDLHQANEASLPSSNTQTSVIVVGVFAAVLAFFALVIAVLQLFSTPRHEPDEEILDLPVDNDHVNEEQTLGINLHQDLDHTAQPNENPSLETLHHQARQSSGTV